MDLESSPLVSGKSGPPSAAFAEAQNANWRTSARKPIYAFTAIFIGIVALEALRSQGKLPTLEGEGKDFDMLDKLNRASRGSYGLKGYRVSTGELHLKKFINGSDERITFMGRHKIDWESGGRVFDNPGVAFGLMFKGSITFGLEYSEPSWPGKGENRQQIGYGVYNKYGKRLTSVFRVWIDNVEQPRFLVNPSQYLETYTFPRLDQNALEYDKWHTVVFQKVSDITYSYGGTLKGFYFEGDTEIKAIPKHSEGAIPPPLIDMHNAHKRRLDFLGDAWAAGEAIRG
eukprot:CAMPEP_0118925818 /NCGR_PEP_ID=MMETSP1169-20130426/3643_1 /TAXON_ID=36882 /ORGANISM="Pyramimonas obovata, Strain CCMP722" /LENGTH=285 /DNA_ID=CAMNT_0006867223 /DNA_START=74 /DNA_END=927 /DNA_ORIENTATION=+